MILTPEEQADAREEIDYLISVHGYEYVWGAETFASRVGGILRDAPARIAGGLQKIGSNPTVIEMNEKLKAHNAHLCEQEAQRDQMSVFRGSNGTTRKSRGKSLPRHDLESFDLDDDHL
jgi:hypothetical protein